MSTTTSAINAYAVRDPDGSITVRNLRCNFCGVDSADVNEKQIDAGACVSCNKPYRNNTIDWDFYRLQAEQREKTQCQ